MVLLVGGTLAMVLAATMCLVLSLMVDFPIVVFLIFICDYFTHVGGRLHLYFNIAVLVTAT